MGANLSVSCSFECGTCHDTARDTKTTPKPHNAQDHVSEPRNVTKKGRTVSQNVAANDTAKTHQPAGDRTTIKLNASNPNSAMRKTSESFAIFEPREVHRSAKHVRFSPSQPHRPESDYRRQRLFKRTSEHYVAGHYADSSGKLGKGFVDTSGFRAWAKAAKITPFAEDESL